jgi:hypothetical protein
MKLQEIDKKRYRGRLRVVFAAIAAALMIIALASSTLMIRLLSTPEASHFWHNLAGVVVAAVVVAVVLQKLRHHPYLFEVVYVWDLKQQLNQIYRKQRQVEAAVDEGDPDAFVVMNFFYRGSEQLYQLDDNTITMDALETRIRVLERKAEEAGLTLSTDAFRAQMLDRFS